jgi:hypothetical protein
MVDPKMAQGHPHWPAAYLSNFCLRRAVMRLRHLQPGRRAARAVMLRRPAHNRTTCPRSGCCKSSVRQKSTVVRTVSVRNVMRPEADIMRHDAEVHARSAANPMTDVSYFVRAGFRGWR